MGLGSVDRVDRSRPRNVQSAVAAVRHGRRVDEGDREHLRHRLKDQGRRSRNVGGAQQDQVLAAGSNVQRRRRTCARATLVKNDLLIM